MIEWLQANITKYKGNPGPHVHLGAFRGQWSAWHNTSAGPELHGPKGVGLKGAVLMSGNPVPGLGALAGGTPAGGAGAAAARGAQAGGGTANALAGAGSTCGEGGANSTAGAVSGPSEGRPRLHVAERRRAGPAAGGRGGQSVDAPAQAARSNLPGFKATKVAILLARAELDPESTARCPHRTSLCTMRCVKRMVQKRRWRRTLSNDALPKGKQPYVRGVLHRHSGQNCFRTHTRLDKEGPIDRNHWLQRQSNPVELRRAVDPRNELLPIFPYGIHPGGRGTAVSHRTAGDLQLGARLEIAQPIPARCKVLGPSASNPQVVTLPFLSLTSTCSHECGLVYWNSLTTPSTVTVFSFSNMRRNDGPARHA